MLKKSRTKFTFILIILFLFSINLTIYAEEPLRVNENDLIYFVFTDRFNDGDKTNNQSVNINDPAAYHGGDFQGIIDKLDYIKDLGFTTIWISPVVENQIRGYHGYWATDFYKTNEHFGSMDKLKELVEKAHQKDIKVIMDIVLNHTGHLHPYVGDENHEGWFHPRQDIKDYNNQEQVENGWLASLPDFDQNNPEVKKYLIDMAKWWIKETNIDGFRLDTVRHVPKSFWNEFSDAIKKDYPNFYLMGEVFHGDINYVGDYQKNAGLDGLVDFPMYYAINDVFKDMRPATGLAEAIKNSNNYKDKYLMGTFIDNHDVPRFVSQLSKLKDEKLKNALTFLMTYTGIPIMYYGTEIGMDGGSDPDNRRDMDFTIKSPITEYVKKLTEIRKSNKALTKGDINVLKADKYFLSYSRKYENNTVIITFNTSNLEKQVEFNIPEVDIGKETLLMDILSSKTVEIDNGKVNLTMSPMESNIFIFTKDISDNNTNNDSSNNASNSKNSNSHNYSILIISSLAIIAIILFSLFILKYKGNK